MAEVHKEVIPNWGMDANFIRHVEAGNKKLGKWVTDFTKGDTRMNPDQRTQKGEHGYVSVTLSLYAREPSGQF